MDTLAAAHRQHTPSNGDLRNPRISSRSFFQDTTWDFGEETKTPGRGPSHKVINWAFRLPNGELFTSPAYSAMLQATKQWLFFRLKQPQRGGVIGASSAIAYLSQFRLLLHFVTTDLCPVRRFTDVSVYHIEDFAKRLATSRNSIKHTGAILSIVADFYHHRHVLTDCLTVHPSQSDTATALIRKANSAMKVAKTEVIKDEVLKPLLSGALEYVDTFSPYLLAVRARLEELRVEKRFVYGGRSRAFDYAQKVLFRDRVINTARLGGTSLARGVRSIHELDRHLNHIRTACFIVVAFATGMRLSEILSLEAGAISRETQIGAPDLIWLRSRCYKYRGVPDGTEMKWLAGPLVERAVEVLELLSAPTREAWGTERLFGPVSYSSRSHPSSKGITTTDNGIRKGLDAFIKERKIVDPAGQPAHVRPHMFRRTFAREVVRAGVMFLALKEHFKHVWSNMTELYIGNDVELWQEILSERTHGGAESFDALLHGEPDDCSPSS